MWDITVGNMNTPGRDVQSSNPLMAQAFTMLLGAYDLQSGN